LVKLLGNPRLWSGIKEAVNRGVFTLIFIASTRVSTIPGISIAGSSPEATLLTPTLDVEYLLLGRPRSLDAIPVTPEGVPTPALISRAVYRAKGFPLLIVDAGSYREPKIPHIALPSRRVGGRIDIEDALPKRTAEALFEEAKVLASSLSPAAEVFFVGESMPGGTTTAMTIMEALGFRARGRVSSAAPRNPHQLKEKVLLDAFKRARAEPPIEDPIEAVANFGDPLHISLAGFAAGALERGRYVILSGGTQMCAVLAILRRMGYLFRDRLAVATTQWLVEDSSSDFIGLVGEVAPGVGVAIAELSFSDAPYIGLRAYEEGYVKEGVGAGGLAALYVLTGGNEEKLKHAIYREYEELMGHGSA